MVMNSTNAVEVSIQAVSPELSVGVAGAAGTAGAATAGAVDAGVSSPKTSMGNAARTTTPITPSTFFRLIDLDIEFSPVYQSASLPVSPVRIRTTCLLSF